jgi:high-affinity iron transporter
VLVAYLIMLREGIEAALIVGIIASYLFQTGRGEWMASVWLGVGLAIALCVVVGVALDLTSGEFPQRKQELFEGGVALVAVTILTSMVFWMKKAARSIKRELHQSVDSALRPGDRQGWALVGMAFLAVGREGLESVFFLLAIVQQSEGFGVPVGAFLGLLSAVGVGVAITYGGMKIDLRRFFRWTGAFIVLVAAGLLAGAVRSFHEAGLWNGLQERAFDLSAILPADGVLGTLLSGLLGYQDSPTIGEVLAWALFLVPALILFFTQPRPGVAARPA